MTGPLLDRFGRVADDLRVSVTDRCNFRCTYCMPAEGMEWLSRAEVLSLDEICRLVGVFLELGVRTVRLTGGEPLVRRDVDQLVRRLRDLGVPELSMTTNGFLLADRAERLARAGLTRINVSVDSLLSHRFAALTRRDGLSRVKAGLHAAEQAGLVPVKLNCVVIRGTNDDEVVDFARFSRATGFEVRFIEFMPLDAEGGWRADQVVPSDEILSAIDAAFPIVPLTHGPEPARLYRFVDGSPGRIGVVASVTRPFCGDCNRVRLTADGQFRTCLFALDEIDLRGLLRGGAADHVIADAIRRAVDGKWMGHSIGSPVFVRPLRSMSMIGG